MPRTTTRSPADPSEGNERAEVDWKELVELAGRRAIERCRGTPIEPAEIAQEALVRLWLEFDRVRNRRAWLSRVVANLVVSELRRLRVRREALVPGPGSDDSDPAASLLVSVELRGTLARTSHPDLLCLTLYAAGYSHREMAEALGEPVHRVGPRVARALGRLRRKLFRETRPRPGRTIAGLTAIDRAGRTSSPLEAGLHERTPPRPPTIPVPARRVTARCGRTFDEGDGKP